jgi:hypothetical protein
VPNFSPKKFPGFQAGRAGSLPPSPSAKPALAQAAQHREALEPGAVHPRGLEADQPVLGGCVERGEVVAPRARLTSLEQVVGEEPEVGLDARGGPGLPGRGRLDRETGEQRDRDESGAQWRPIP